MSSRGVNTVHLIGNVGNDPEMKYTQGGMAIASVSLATTSTRKDTNGNQTERTEWHRVKFFGKLAEIVGQYVKKGSKLYVEGSIRYDKYDKDGVTHYTTDIVGDEMQMLGGLPGAGEQRTQAPARPQRDSNRPAARRPEAQHPDPHAAMDDFVDDSIPF